MNYQRTILLLILGLAGLPLNAQQQFNGFCARVKIAIQQELTLERIGFEATLEVTNNDALDSLTEFSAELEFIDPSKEPGDEGYDAADLFFVQPPVLTNVNRIDGQGVVGPTKKAVVRWFIIPKTETGGTDPNGRVFLVGCRLNANLRGEPVPADSLQVIPDDITVKPEPQLEIRYFQPRDVQGDDPFTTEVESPIPFTLGVLVTNAGWGPARNLQIESQQPRIEENKQGLLLVARLLGARVQDSPLDESSLTVNLGDIPPQQTRKGAWDMITSLSGEFIEFSARYTHAAELGGEETSLINLLEAHFIVGEVLNDEPGRDRILDFLADVDRDGERIADTLFETDGTILPVNHLQRVTVNNYTGPRTFTMDLEADFEGWGYIRVDDPGQANLEIESILRSDGKVLNPNNFWTSYRYRESDNARLAFLEMMDRVENDTNYTYTVTYKAPTEDFDPPITRLRFAGEVTESNGQFFVNRDTQMYFTSEDESPVAIEYRLDGGDYRPALPFRLLEPGTYVMDFFATDAAGNVEATQQAILVLDEDGPGFDQFTVQEPRLYLAGSTLSVRPQEAVLNLQVGESPVPVDAELSVYRGIQVHPVVNGVPFSPTPLTDLDLMISGELVDFYRYRVNGGNWSSSQPVSAPLPIRGQSGLVVVDIQGRSQYGSFSTSETLTLNWTVDPTAPNFQVENLPAITDNGFAVNATVNGSGIPLFRWTIDGSFYRAEQPMGSTIELEGLAPGQHRLDLIIQEEDGSWDERSVDVSYTWTIDPAYGTDMSNVPEVLTQSYPGAEGSSINFAWAGLNDQNELLPPGWYTVLVQLSDTLGNLRNSKRLLQIEQLSGSGVAVAEAESGPQRPYAEGNWVVWQETASGASNIRASKIREQVDSVLELTDTVFSQENPVTDGRHAVWQGRRENGTWDIYLVDLENPTIVQQVTDTLSYNETRPSLDYPWLVYEKRPDDGSSPPQLEAMNLETNDTFFVFPGPDDQLFPAVDAGRVVWQDFRNPGSGEIYYQDLETGASLRLSQDNFGQFHPDIDGAWVVWQDNREGQVEIYGHHLLKGETLKLTAGAGDKAYPYLVGELLLYEDDSIGGETVNFQLMDLNTLRSMPLTRSELQKNSGSLAVNHLVWLQQEPEGTVVRQAELPVLQSVFTNNNAVVVTEGMTTGYGNAFSLLADWFAVAGVESISRYTGAIPDWTQETATMVDGSPTGVNFPLVPGEFIWVYFPSEEVLDLGAQSTALVDLPSGMSAFSYDRFPLGYSGEALIRDMGAENVVGIRMLDAETGFWRTIEVGSEGELLGPNFFIPPAAVVLLNLSGEISGWEPFQP